MRGAKIAGTSNLAMVGLVFSVVAALGLAIGFGITATNQGHELALAKVRLQEGDLRNAQQDSVLFELIQNSTDPVPTRTVLLSGTYTFEFDGTQFNDLAYRFIRVVAASNEFIYLEVDMPTSPLPITYSNSELYWYGFDYFMYLGLATATYNYLPLSKSNLDKMVVSSGCLASGECFLAYDTTDIPIINTIATQYAIPQEYVTRFEGPDSVLVDQTLTFTGPLQFLIPIA